MCERNSIEKKNTTWVGLSKAELHDASDYCVTERFQNETDVKI